MTFRARHGGQLSALALALLTAYSIPATALAVTPALGFNDEQPVRNDLVDGTLRGMVKFAQTHTIDPANNSTNEMPTLVSERTALVMLIPEQPIAETASGQVKVTAMRGNQVLGERLLNPPLLFPNADRNARDERPDVQYSLKAWTAQLPWDWMKPGLSLRFSTPQQSGSLEERAIEFAGPAELVMQHIRIGMLNEPTPAGGNWFETKPGLATIDYFQKIPVARLTVGQYLPVHLEKVVMPNGTVYESASAGQGGVHTGDMREDIGKALIATGINLANFGIVDSAGNSQTQPGLFREVVVHQNVGRYANGVVRHGLSGGNGMVTLLDTDNNELTHEMGHTFGLGHFPGGGQWSSHNGGSGWGYDSFRNRMMSNLYWSRAAADNLIEGVTTAPYKGIYRFGQDPMAGGSPIGVFSKTTLHTGYSMKRVQQAMEKSSQVDAHSSTGYTHWDAASKRVVETPGRNRPAQFGVPVVTLVGFYDPQGTLPTTLYPPLFGNYGFTYNLAKPTAGTGCYLNVRMNDGAQLNVELSAKRLQATQMNKFHVNIPAASQPGLVNVYCTIDGQKQHLAEMRVDMPKQPLPAAVSVGKADGFLQAALRLPELRQSVPGRFASSNAFESEVADIYGEIRHWSESRTGPVGALYVYENPYTALREYFQLKSTRYGYFPTDGTSNASWRYMGKAEDSVNWTPEPARAAFKTTGTVLADKVMAYYGATQLKGWKQGDTSVRRGQVYHYNNPYSKTHEYFMARGSSYHYFPTDARSNRYWTYLGNDASMNAVFFPTNTADFEQRLAAWHGQDSLRSWASAGKGVVGEIYRYPYGQRVDYFRLKTANYWYFPTNKTSNSYWEYLGSRE